MTGLFMKLKLFEEHDVYFKQKCISKSLSIMAMLFPLLSINLTAEIHLTTLSDWEIDSFNEHTLLVAKTSENSTNIKSIIGFHVERPVCISTRPILMISSKTKKYSNGDIVFAQMIVDKNKPKVLKLELEYGFESNDEYVSWFQLKKFPSFDNAKRIEVKFNKETPLKSFVIDSTGISKASFIAEQLCNSQIQIKQVNTMEKI